MPDDLRCAPARPGVPAFTNLPAAVTAARRGAGAFTATAAIEPAAPLSFSLVSTTCSFPVSVDAASGGVSFTCGAASEACEAVLGVSSGQGRDDGALSITCANAAPAYRRRHLTRGHHADR